MIYELKTFQAEALSDLRDNVDSAKYENSKNGKQQIISLTAPTGSGKTIIATSLIEDVLTGNEAYLEEPDTIFVWLSDSPELNEQSKMKIEKTADRLKFGQCITIDANSFNQEFLEEGYIYFLNTQKLSKKSRLVNGGDGRDYTIWDTLQNTIEEKGDKLIVIIDEAHRGMKDNKAKEATTTMQKFIKGSDADGLSPCPIVIGMSATIDRFNALVSGVNATTRQVNIPPSKVRASGLLKEEVKALYPEDVHGRVDMAVLQAAADDWQKKCDHWDIFYQTQKSKRVLPVFLVQVENGTAGKISNTDLDEVINTIETRLGYTFGDDEVVHTFGEKATLTINGRTVRYEEPSRIEQNKDVKVVLFKDALSVGWDCPRAETMISFRKANDATYIAQLLGRMFRTPLAQSVTTDEYLNSVYLFLPYFDKNTVEKIVKALKEEEGGAAVEVSGGTITDTPTLTSAPPAPKKPAAPVTKPAPAPSPISKHNTVETEPATVDEANAGAYEHEKPAVVPEVAETAEYSGDPTGTIFDPALTGGDTIQPESQESSAETTDPATKPDAEPEEEDNVIDDGIDRVSIIDYINAKGIPSYEVRKDKINDYLKSLFRFAGFLHQTGIYAKAVEDIKTDIAKMIDAYIEKLKADGSYNDMVKKALEFSLAVQTFDTFGESVTKDTIENLLSTTDVDIDRQFKMAERQLKNEGVGNKYGQEYAEEEAYNGFKIDVIMFTNDADAMDALTEYAEKKYHELIDKYRPTIKTLPSEKKDKFKKIVNDGDAISQHLLDLPYGIDPYSQTARCYGKHLYIDYSTGCAKIKLNAWEEGVLQEECKKDDFVCWLRNPDRRTWALCIPYEKGGYYEKMYPDFIVVRKDGPHDYFIDILEPHDPSRNDNVGKAKGLARYAEDDYYFGRVQLIRQEKDSTGHVGYKRLDMSKSNVRTRVRGVTSNEELDRVFDDLGFFE